MLPPVEPQILTANPKFEALYNDLCKHKISQDGTSRLETKAQREHDALSEELRKARTEAVKRDLVKSGLECLSYKPDYLPEDLQELVAVVAALLEGQIADEDKDLLQDDLIKFKENTKLTAASLSKLLQQDANSLAELIDPDAPPSLQSVATYAAEQKDSIATSRSKLAEARLAIGHEASTLHELYRHVIKSSIRVLEGTMHGSVARGTKAKADYLALVAEGMSKKLSIQQGQLMFQLYSTDVQKALQEKHGGLENDIRTTKRKAREVDDKLEEYRKAGEIEGMAQEYADILSETDKVKADIARLHDGKK